jgi:hypothetical protein
VKRKVEKVKHSTKEGYCIAKLRAKGYSMNFFDDNGETKVLTDFEARIPLYLVPLDEFDKVLTTIQSDHGGKSMSLAEFVEKLSNTEFYTFYPILKDISSEGKLLHKVFTHRVL